MDVMKRENRALAAQLCGLILVTVFALWLITAVLWQPLPAANELETVTGTYERLERQGNGGYRLYIRDGSNYTEWYTIESYVAFSSEDLTAAAQSGDSVSLRHGADKLRTVAELTVGDTALLTYEEVQEDYRINNVWGLWVATMVALLAALCAGLLLSRWRKKKRQKEIQKILEELESERMSRRKREPEPYRPEERQTVEEYIEEAFGPIQQIFFDPETEGLRVDVAVVAPEDDDDFYKLVTIGMGAWRMEVPPELAERNCAFGELCMFLPPEWALLSRDRDDTWPFHWLKTAAKLSCDGGGWLGVGHCVHTGPLERDSELTELLLAWGAVGEGSTPRLMLPGGKLVNFYQLVPLYADEVRYRNERGFSRLWQRLMSREIGPVVDMQRECCYDPELDFALELSPFLWTQGERECDFGLYTGDFLQEQFEAAGLDGSGHDWEVLARAFLEKRFPTLAPYIHFDSEEGMFFAYTDAEDALRIFALAFRDLCGDETAFGELLTRISENEA